MVRAGRPSPVVSSPRFFFGHGYVALASAPFRFPRHIFGPQARPVFVSVPISFCPSCYLGRSPADLSNSADVERLFATVRREYGRLDLLFNNAGAAMPPTPVHQTTYAEWRRVVGINLDAAFHVAKEAFVRPSPALSQAQAQAPVCTGTHRHRHP